jgi:syntaxin-binding protein 5
LAYGNESGLVVIDIVQKISLVILNTSDLGGSDPQRVLRSPKRQDDSKRENEDKARSPSTDQVKYTFFSKSFLKSDTFQYPILTP